MGENSRRADMSGLTSRQQFKGQMSYLAHWQLFSFLSETRTDGWFELLKVEFLLKTESGYLRDAEVT